MSIYIINSHIKAANARCKPQITAVCKPCLPGQRLLVIFGRLPHNVRQGPGKVRDMLPGTGGDLQSLQGSLGAHVLQEHRQDGLLVPLGSGGAQHRAKARVKVSSCAVQVCQKPTPGAVQSGVTSALIE